MTKKRYKGIIEAWYFQEYPPEVAIVNTPDGCYAIRGFIWDHPSFHNGVWFRSSQVITPRSECVEDAVVETLNSIYKLGKRDETNGDTGKVRLDGEKVQSKDVEQPFI